ncbi:hypothetical protein ACWCSD_32510 [Nonomuraea sp. NPDC001684]
MKFNAEMRGEVAGGRIKLHAEKMHGVPVPDQVARLIRCPIPLYLPFDVKLIGVRNPPDGLELSAEAFDVLSRG